MQWRRTQILGVAATTSILKGDTHYYILQYFTYPLMFIF